MHSLVKFHNNDMLTFEQLKTDLKPGTMLVYSDSARGCAILIHKVRYDKVHKFLSVHGLITESVSSTIVDGLAVYYDVPDKEWWKNLILIQAA